MEHETLIYIGGGLHIFFAIFDLFWPKVFNWKETLSPLDDVNKSLLKIANKLLIVVYLIFAYISFFHATELLTSGLGKSLLFAISMYWLIRAVMEPIFFSLKEKEHLIFFGIFILTLSMYVVPFVDTIK